MFRSQVISQEFLVRKGTYVCAGPFMQHCPTKPSWQAGNSSARPLSPHQRVEEVGAAGKLAQGIHS